MDGWMDEWMNGWINHGTHYLMFFFTDEGILANELLLGKFVIHFNDQKGKAYIAEKSNGK